MQTPYEVRKSPMLDDRRSTPSTSSVLRLSTAHVPGPHTSWDEVDCSAATSETEHGWFVRLSSEVDDDDLLPAWIKPAAALARKHDCMAILFDSCEDRVEGLPEYLGQWDGMTDCCRDCMVDGIEGRTLTRRELPTSKHPQLICDNCWNVRQLEANLS